MPPQNPDEPGRVEVALSFLSGHDSAAFTQMTEAYKQARLMFESMKANNFVEQAEKLVKLTDQMNRSTEQLRRIESDSRAAQQRGGGLLGGVENALGAARRAAGRPTAMPQEEAAANIRDEQRRQRDTADDERKEQQQKERDRLDAMDPEERHAIRLREQARIPQKGMPGGDDPDAWYNRVTQTRGEEPPNEGVFRIPRYGELNLQDYLNAARDQRLKQAIEAGSRGDTEGMDRRGEQAAQLENYSRRVGEYNAARNLLTRANNFMQGNVVTQTLAQWDTGGAALGFSRTPGQTIFGGVPLPFQAPWSPAGREGERQWRDTLTNRFLPGINGQQAQAITDATARAGFSGQRGTDMRLDFMAPLVQRTGVDPQALIPFTQTLRTGTGSIQEMSRALADLGEMARTAQVDVNTYAEALAASGEAAQQQGGYFNSGVQFGRQFTQGTGLTPNVGNQVLQNPMTSAILGGMTGLPSFAQAAAPASAKLDASMLGMRMYYQAYAGALGTQTPGLQVRQDGETLGTLRGDNPAVAAVASRYGISADEAEAMLRGQGRQQKVNNLENVLQLYEQESGDRYRGKGKQLNQRASKWAKAQDGGMTTRWNEKTSKFESKHVDETTGKVEWRADTGGVMTQFSKEVGKADMARMEANPKGVDRDDLVKAAHRAGIVGKELGEALDKKSPEARVKAVRSLMADRSAEEQAKYQIAFTGPAKKFFKALVNDKGGDLGKVDWDSPSNVSAASSRGPAPLTNLGNSGLGPLDTQGG